jgi:hypothetical protein
MFMLLPLVLSLVAASPLDEVDVAKDILHRLLQASTYAEGARPEVFTVHANGLSYENIAGGAFALRNETLSAVFHRGPLRISNLQVRYPSNRNLDGLSKISDLILNRIATNVAKVLVPQMFTVEVESKENGHFIASLLIDGIHVGIRLAISLTIDPWSGCLMSLSWSYPIELVQPPHAWTPGISSSAAFELAQQVYAASVPPAGVSKVYWELVYAIPSFQHYPNQMTAAHYAGAQENRLMPFYRLVVDTITTKNLVGTSVYIDAQTGRPTARYRIELDPVGKPPALGGLGETTTVTVAATGDRLVLGKEAVGEKLVGGISLDLLLTKEQMVTAVAYPDKHVLEIEGRRVRYTGEIRLEKLRELEKFRFPKK